MCIAICPPSSCDSRRRRALRGRGVQSQGCRCDALQPTLAPCCCYRWVARDVSLPCRIGGSGALGWLPANGALALAMGAWERRARCQVIGQGQTRF